MGSRPRLAHLCHRLISIPRLKVRQHRRSYLLWKMARVVREEARLKKIWVLKKEEAGKLIKYHLDNYKRNPAYCLPASLRPTLVQRTVPHDSIIDTILHPELRDSMILLRDRFDLAECTTAYLWATVIHGEDVLAHTNWEISEDWLRRYNFLVDDSLLNSANRWRRERGDVDLTLSDIGQSREDARR